MPLALPGQRIGLLGGSFDPAHDGHLLISEMALKRFRLDRIWWLVSPGNPLKAHGPAPLADRMAQARDLARDPRITVTDIERHLRTRLTADTLAEMEMLWPRVRFVWLMGSDNLVQFTQWNRWREIAARMPIGVLARPGSRTTARFSRAATALAPWRLPETMAGRLADMSPPAWVLVNIPMSPLSSTAIRAARGASSEAPPSLPSAERV